MVCVVDFKIKSCSGSSLDKIKSNETKYKKSITVFFPSFAAAEDNFF